LSDPKGGEGIVRSIHLLSSALLLLFCTALTMADEGTGQRSTYLLQSSVVGAAGSPGASGSLRSVGTLGQPTPIGVGSTEELTLYAGFWTRVLQYLADADPQVPEVWTTELLGTYPNPIRDAAAIRFALASPGPVELTIFDVNGRRIRRLVDGHVLPGPHEVAWDGRDDLGAAVPSGVYFYRLSSNSFDSVKRMLILR
jgi:hypothetical protein